MNYIIKNEDEIIFIGELIDRWPGALHEDIIYLITNNILSCYWKKKKCGNDFYLKPYDLQYKETDAVGGVYIYGTNTYNNYDDGRQAMACFLTSQMSKIEKEYPEFIYKRTDISSDNKVIGRTDIEKLKNSYSIERNKLLAKIKSLENEDISSLNSQVETLKTELLNQTNFQKGISRTTYQKIISILFDKLNIPVEKDKLAEAKRKIGNSYLSLDDNTLEKIMKDIQNFRAKTSREN